MDTWIFYATVAFTVGDKDRADIDQLIDEYADYLDKEDYEIETIETITEDGVPVVRMDISKDTRIEVTGNDIEGGEPDEILFEPDEIDEDPYEWADYLNNPDLGISVECAWFDLDD